MRAKNLAVAALGSLLGDVVAQRTPNQLATGDSRIINGQPADVADYPFLVSIRASEDGESGICGGTVIAPNVVLTAAHCVTPDAQYPEPLGSPYNSINNYLMPMVVTAADVPANDPDLPVPTTNLVPTKAVVTSAGWAENPVTVAGLDIALLLLEEDLLDVEVASLPAAGTTYSSGEAFNIAGWGNTSPTDTIYPTTLMEATVNYVPRRTCYDLLVEVDQYLPSDGFAIDNSWICAQGPEVGGYYTDACQGDSGGPMSIIDGLTGRATVVGVVSWGFGCGGTTPGVYTNVEYFTPWIEHWLSVWEDKGLIHE